MPNDDKAVIQRALDRLRFAASRAEAIQDLIKDGNTAQALARIAALVGDISHSKGLIIEAE